MLKAANQIKMLQHSHTIFECFPRCTRFALIAGMFEAGISIRGLGTLINKVRFDVNKIVQLQETVLFEENPQIKSLA